MERLVICFLVVYLVILVSLPELDTAAPGMCETIYTVHIIYCVLQLCLVPIVKLCGIIINALINESLSNDINSLV